MFKFKKSIRFIVGILDDKMPHVVASYLKKHCVVELIDISPMCNTNNYNFSFTVSTQMENMFASANINLDQYKQKYLTTFAYFVFYKKTCLIIKPDENNIVDIYVTYNAKQGSITAKQNMRGLKLLNMLLSNNFLNINYTDKYYPFSDL